MARIAKIGFLTLATLCACARRPGTVAPIPPPSTDVFLYRFASGGRPSGVFNITNRPGYDNQPSWDGNSRVLWTAIENGQADIHALSFETSALGPVIRTPESEYSPALTPDGSAISVVRVESDSTQRLWRFPTDGSAPSPVLEDIEPVGYYAWLDSTTVALFVLGRPNTLRIADTRTGEAWIVTTDIGRSLQRVPGGRRASFVQRANGSVLLKTVDPARGSDGRFEIDTVAILPDSAEYVAWASETELYTVAGSRIFRLTTSSGTWEVVDDLASRGVRGLTRLALSPDRSRLALAGAGR